MYSYKYQAKRSFLAACNKSPVNSTQAKLHPPTPSPAPAPGQYDVSGSSDSGRIPVVIIDIMPDNSLSEISYKFVILMARFILPWPGYWLTALRTNSKPTTILLRQNSALLQIPVLLPPHHILKFRQRILPVEIQIILPVILPVKISQAWYLHSYLRNHRKSYH